VESRSGVEYSGASPTDSPTELRAARSVRLPSASGKPRLRAAAVEAVAPRRDCRSEKNLDLSCAPASGARLEANPVGDRNDCGVAGDRRAGSETFSQH